MAQIEVAAFAGAGMGLAKGFRVGPGLEGVFRFPEGMGSVEDVVVALGAAQEVELDEAGRPV